MRKIKFIFQSCLLIALSVQISCSNLSLSSNSKQIQCRQTRAAYDIGSGSTRLKVAKVDVCENKILETLYENKMAMPYKDELSQSSDRKFTETTLQKGLGILKELKTQADIHKPEVHYAVATQAFREALNASEFISRAQNLGIKAKVISQSEEAELAFYAVKFLGQIDADQLLVWDIGGGSQQMSYQVDAEQKALERAAKQANSVAESSQEQAQNNSTNSTIKTEEKKELRLYESLVASVPFKQEIISSIKKQNPKTLKSPNPLNQKQVNEAIKLGRGKARRLPAHFKEELKNQNNKIVGVGGVFYGIGSNLTKDFISKNPNNPEMQIREFTADDLYQSIQKRIGWNDTQIGGNYADTDLSNMILIYSFMQELKISKIQLMSFNLTEGILIR